MIRICDLLFAGIGILLLAPLMVLLAIAGWLDTGSPIFSQTRVGLGKKPFTLIKFRTMPVDTQSVATHLLDGKSVTRLGAIMRKTKLDELPQLINVLKGDMSLVGPRPCLFNQKELIAEREARGVLDVLPGITGLAQINAIDMSKPKTLAEWDQRMIASMSVRNYFKYIVMTVLGRRASDRLH